MVVYATLECVTQAQTAVIKISVSPVQAKRGAPVMMIKTAIARSHVSELNQDSDVLIVEVNRDVRAPKLRHVMIT